MKGNRRVGEIKIRLKENCWHN